MAEIKSTMDMVLARAAAMSAAATTASGGQDLLQDGMRLGAAYLRKEVEDLGLALGKPPEADRSSLRLGFIQTMLRNIVLPRSEEQSSDQAIQGLIEAGKAKYGLDLAANGELVRVLSELKGLLDHYLEHRRQLEQQLKDNFAMQLAHMEEAMGQKAGRSAKIDPTRHPKFQEEWLRLQGDLNEQYGNAIAQHKEFVRERLS